MDTGVSLTVIMGILIFIYIAYSYYKYAKKPDPDDVPEIFLDPSIEGPIESLNPGSENEEPELEMEPMLDQEEQGPDEVPNDDEDINIVEGIEQVNNGDETDEENNSSITPDIT